jgi:arabinogalactan endo-1,4-beta-galactosidase
MNEKITALMEQATSGACYDNSDYIMIHGVDIKCFAELIVKECIGFFENINDRKDAVAMLKVHFGVEE